MDKIFNKPFAINGARVAIPENGTENERVSFDKGFTQPYEVEAPSVDNPGGQGFNILRPEMNEALYQLSNACNLLAENIDKWTLLTTENLNDIKQAGRYYQNLNKNATNERNYPENVGGYLIVLNNGIGPYGVTQIYKTWNFERIYTRRTTTLTNWSAWDSLMLTSTANSTYRKIADSYTKSEVDSLIISTNGYSRSNYKPNNISNATIPIPNKSVILGCAILVTCKYNLPTNGNIKTTFTFKIDGTSIGTVTIEKQGNTGAGGGTFYAMGQTYLDLSGKLGKTIIPSLKDTGGIKLTTFNFLVVWQ